MKKAFLPVLIIVLVVVMISSFVISGMLAFSSPDWKNKLALITDQLKINHSSSIDNHETAEITNIKSIEIAGIYSKIIINKTSKDMIDASYKGDSVSFFSTKEKPQLKISKSDDLVKIIVDDADKNLHFSSSIYSNSVLEIIIPEKYTGIIKVNCVSGSINLSDLKIEGLTTGTVSGEISITNATTKNLVLNTTSGSTNLKEVTGAIKFASVSGSLNATLSALTDKITLNSTSGSFNLVIPKDTPFNASLSSVSGKYTPPANYVHGGVEIKASTVSGSLDIDIKE